MPKHFYYQVMGEVYGPLTGVQLRDKALGGDVSADTLCRIDDGDWVLASKLTNLFDEHGRPIGHEVIAGVIPDYAAFREANKPPEEQMAAQSAVAAAAVDDWDVEESGRSYFMLQLYSFLCRGFGGLGLAGVLVSVLLLAFTDWWFPLPGAVLGCVAMASFALLAFGEAIIAFIHLVEDNHRCNDLLERLARNQERQLFQLEQRK